MTIAALCGGSGTRLFPLSRELMPKQFANILPPKDTQKSAKSEPLSLFQATLLRNQFLKQSYSAKICVITNENHFFLAQEQASACEVAIDDMILESVGKNTASALTFCALSVLDSTKDTKDSESSDLILALPCDHLIKQDKAYKSAIQQGISLALKGFLVTFGIKPTSPHTGYGYIKAKDNLVEKFVEKPNLATAKDYVESGNYLWNSGMFCFKASVFLKELELYAKDVYKTCKAVFELSREAKTSHFMRLDATLSKKLIDISIDYALMEQSQKVACVPCEFEWNDIGSFEQLSEEYPKDSKQNATNTTFVAKDCRNNFIHSQKLVAGIGLEDLIIIDENDCLLVAKSGRAQEVKDIVATLKKQNAEITKVHRLAHRPWGSYSVLLESSFYKIKQIIVKPKARLSLQKHFHRNEHWIIVSGSAIVRIGDKEQFLNANQSTYIPAGELHRLENPAILPLVLIEVQMGEYLGEDDIVRVEDDYKR